MPRYFIELAYKGKHFCGFQKQVSEISIQGEVEKALHTILRVPIESTTSSRTDTGVHALQNYLHFDVAKELPETIVYNANAILPKDIVITAIHRVKDDAHSRFDALARTYEYIVYQRKDPFLRDVGYFFTFSLDTEVLNKACSIFKSNKNYQSFCKKHTEVNNYQCQLDVVEWVTEDNMLIFRVKGNRFLRGMVRALVGTSLQIARGKIAIEDLQEIIDSNECQNADFSADAKGLKLIAVDYPKGIFKESIR